MTRDLQKNFFLSTSSGKVFRRLEAKESNCSFQPHNKVKGKRLLSEVKKH